MVAPFSKFYAKIRLGFCLNTGKRYFLASLLSGFSFKPTERVQVLLKNCTRDFLNRPPLERSACFHVTITGDFERFQCFNFQLKILRLKMHYLRTTLHCQKLISRQIEWRIQNGYITKNGVLPVTTLFFFKILFQFKKLYKELI